MPRQSLSSVSRDSRRKDRSRIFFGICHGEEEEEIFLSFGIIISILKIFHFLFVCVVLLQKYCCSICAGPRVDNFQALDPRKQELLEARFLGMRSTSNPAGGSGATLQHQQLQQHAATMAGSHSAGPPPGCHVMTTAATNQLVQQSLQQPSPSSLLNANAPPPPLPPQQQQQQQLATPQFTAAYTNPSTNNHGETEKESPIHSHHYPHHQQQKKIPFSYFVEFKSRVFYYTHTKKKVVRPVCLFH